MKPNHILAGSVKTLVLISAIALTVSSANARSLKFKVQCQRQTLAWLL